MYVPTWLADAWANAVRRFPLARRSTLAKWVAMFKAADADARAAEAEVARLRTNDRHMMESRRRWKDHAGRMEKDNAKLGVQVAELTLESRGLREQLADAERGLKGIADERDAAFFRIKELADGAAELIRIRNNLMDLLREANERADAATEHSTHWEALAGRADERADAERQRAETYADQLGREVDARDAAGREVVKVRGERDAAINRARDAEEVAADRARRIDALRGEVTMLRNDHATVKKQRDDALVVVRAVSAAVTPYIVNDKPTIGRSY
jgi:chromosome segregation ATPase